MTPPPSATGATPTGLPAEQSTALHTGQVTLGTGDTRPAPGDVRSAPDASRAGLLLLIGLLLVALNLRTAITSLGALLDEVRTGLHLSGTLAGVVTTMPPIAFAAFGSLTPWLARRFPPARVLVASMVVLTAGLALRITTDSSLLFIITSALALAGIAVANVLLPMLVKQYFPERTGLVTGAYSMAMTVGTTAAAAAAVPVAHAFDSWRAGLGVWAILATVAVLPWLPRAFRETRRHFRATRVAATDARRPRPGRTRLGWAMVGYFGTQSLNAYAIMGWLAQLFRDAGYPAQTAGLLLAGVTALGLPVSLLMPTVAARLLSLRPLVLAISAAMLLAYVGLAVAPYGPALLWVALLAFGQGAFPLILAVIGLRARTAQGTVALSAFAQGGGYLIGALGPLLVGLLYEATGGWTAPIGFLTGALVVQTVAGLAIARPRYIEDEERR